MRFFYVTTLFLCLQTGIVAQTDTLPPAADDIFVEDILQNATESPDLDQNTLFEELEFYRKHPLDLNSADREQLQELQLLTDLQITRFLEFRRTYGPLLSRYELQVVPGFDLLTIRQLLPFVRISGDLDDFRTPLGEMFVRGDNRLFLRWTSFLEPLAGSTEEDPDRRFLGDPNRYYLRFRHNFENRLSFGITAEKDPGEAFFNANNPAGFDYYSAHLYLRNYRSWLPDLAIGDYRISLGQGLIAYSGFGYGKSADAMRILRPARTIAPYSSVNEFAFFRGAAVRLRPLPEVEATLFYSRKALDARRDDTTFQEEVVSSLLITGFHRTPLEAALADNVQEQTMGGSVKWKKDFGHLAFNLIHSQFGSPVERPDQLYSQFYFRGDDLLNMSIDYDWNWRGLHGFGEVARDQQGAWATSHGLLAAIHPKLDLALLYRHFSPRFQTLYGNAFAETVGTRNENGIYTGFTWRPQKGWIVNGYYDLYQHPWLRFGVDAPSRGADWLFRIERFKKRSWLVYLQFRGENEERNVRNNNTPTDFLRPTRRFNSLLHFAYRISGSIELRTRLGWNVFEEEGAPPTTGWMMYQDVIFRPREFPVSFTSRFALFETEDFNTRFYNFENDLLYVFSIPPYYDRGSRFYLNIRWNVIPDLVLEARYARLFLPRRESIGTGPYEIIGPRRTEVRGQLSWKF